MLPIWVANNGEDFGYIESNLTLPPVLPSCLMSSQDTFERLLASLHAAMLDDTLWPATSALIDEACGLQGNALGVGTGPKDDVQVIPIGLYYRGERREDLEREYFAVYHPRDEAVPRLRQLPDSRVVHVTALYTAEELQTSPTYNELSPRVRNQDGLWVRLAEPDGSHISWLIADPVAPGGWESPQLTLIKGLLPHIRQFVRVRTVLGRAEALSASLTALLDNSRAGVIHLDRRGRIMAANDRARAILRRGDGLVDKGGVLEARVRADTDRLGKLLARALPASGGPALSGSMLIQRASGLPRLAVHIGPVGVRHWDYGGQQVAALVLIVEPGGRARIDPALVAQVLGLTAAQSQVAAALAEGYSVRDIARVTGRQENSVRFLLKQIYKKHGLSGQVDLVRLVLSLTEFAGAWR